MEKINFAFFGTPLLASQTLELMANDDYLPTVIITSPDKPSGRGLILKPSPVYLWAKKHNIPCLKPDKFDEKFYLDFSKYKIQLNIVVAYGKILPEKIINQPKLGTINIHYSLLPKYRGASPVESALLNGDKTTGVSIQQMVYKLDSGPILIKKEIKIDINETKDSLKNKLIIIGNDLLSFILPLIINKKISAIAQDESKASYCQKIKKEDGEIKLTDDPIVNFNKYRALYGWPGIFFFYFKKDKKIRVKINKAIYENNLFHPQRVTPEGKKEINYEDFLKQI